MNLPSRQHDAIEEINERGNFDPEFQGRRLVNGLGLYLNGSYMSKWKHSECAEEHLWDDSSSSVSEDTHSGDFEISSALRVTTLHTGSAAHEGER